MKKLNFLLFSVMVVLLFTQCEHNEYIEDTSSKYNLMQKEPEKVLLSESEITSLLESLSNININESGMSSKDIEELKSQVASRSPLFFTTINSISRNGECCTYFLTPIAGNTIYLINGVAHREGTRIEICSHPASGILFANGQFTILRFICQEEQTCIQIPQPVSSSEGCCSYSLPRLSHGYYVDGSGNILGTQGNIMVCEGDEVNLQIRVNTSFEEDPYRIACEYRLTCTGIDPVEDCCRNMCTGLKMNLDENGCCNLKLTTHFRNGFSCSAYDYIHNVSFNPPIDFVILERLQFSTTYGLCGWNGQTITVTGTSTIDGGERCSNTNTITFENCRGNDSCR